MLVPSVAVGGALKEKPRAVVVAEREGWDTVAAGVALEERVAREALGLEVREGLAVGEPLVAALALALGQAVPVALPPPPLLPEPVALGVALAVKRPVKMVAVALAVGRRAVPLVEKEGEKEALAQVCEALGVVE